MSLRNNRHLWLGLLVIVLAVVLWDVHPAAAQTPETHTVQAGETLSEIAKQYGVEIGDLLRLNGLADADAIIIGQELILPSASTGADATQTHTVQAGEALSQIAKRYDVTMQALMTANEITDPNDIAWGQVLRIPIADEAPQATVTATTSSNSDTGSIDNCQLSIVNCQSSASGEPPGAERPSQHAVLAGETASEIAKRYAVKLADLLAANNIANADAIFVGQILTLPAMATATPATSAAETTAAAQSAEPTSEPTPEPTPIPVPEHPSASLNRSYSVESGDTPMRIALRLGVDPDSFLRLNNLTDDARLVVGQRLLLPATERELRVERNSQQDAEQYVVQPGDSLSAIAKSFGLTQAELMAANRLSNPDSIAVGERLTIPNRAVDGEQAPQQVGPADSGYFYYTVRRGDTLSELARDLGSTKLALIEYNDLPDESTVFAGMELRVPYGPPPLPIELPPVPLSGSSFLVSLSRQQCWIFHGTTVLHEWICSTGYDKFRTRTGAFAVQSKIENAKSTAYQLDMPYWLGIYDVGEYENGIHGLPVEWKTGKKIWSTLIGEPATFGCAMLDDPDAKTLFDLSYLGMPVYIIQ
jgi:LysM repeat protein